MAELATRFDFHPTVINDCERSFLESTVETYILFDPGYTLLITGLG
jgi:hypothetical protein